MDIKNYKIIFMGTPSISAKVFERMINEGYNFIGLICQPDKPVGRKNIITPCPTKEVAIKYNIPVYQPIRIRKEFEFVKELNPDLILTFAYGQIVPEEVLNAPKLGCINLHGSLLPKLRGAAPIQYSLINGDKKTGVTLMEMLKEMDAGRMYAKKEVIIEDDDNATSLFEKISLCAGDFILEVLPSYLEGKLPGEKQNEEEVTFAHMISKDMEKLDLNLPCESFINWVRGLSYTPGGYLYLDQKKFKIYKARKYSDSISNKVGEIIKADPKGFLMQLKDGVISLLEVQEEGKKMMDYKSYTNGNHNLVGKIFE